MTGPFGVGAAFVNKLLRLHRTGADVAPRPHGGGYPACLLPRHEKLLRSQVRRQQDATLEELRTHLEEPAGLAVSISTVSRALIRLDLGRKKSLAAIDTEMTRRYGRAPRRERVCDSAPQTTAHTLRSSARWACAGWWRR